MEASLELEDDIFFADLSKQISLLIMDADEDSLTHCPSVNLQAFTQVMHPAIQTSYISYDKQQTYNKRESKGTGVFIPLSSDPRRRNVKQRRFASASGNKFQRPSFDHNSRGVPQMAYNNNNNNNNNISQSYHSVNHRPY